MSIYHQVQLYSERCSGSNFLEVLLKDNLSFSKAEGGFDKKHWLDPEVIEGGPFPGGYLLVLLVRSPFQWLRSIHRTPWHASLGLRSAKFSKFIRSRWLCVIDEHAGVTPKSQWYGQALLKECNLEENGRPFKNVLEMRSVKHRFWLEHLRQCPDSLQIQYENLASDPKNELQKIAERVGQGLPDPVIVSPFYKGAVSWKRKLVNQLSFGKLGKFKPRPVYPLSLEDIDFIEKTLDPGVESSLGYNLQALAEEERERTVRAWQNG